MRPKTVAVSHRKHMDLSLCAQRHVLAKRLLRLAPPDRLMHTKTLRFRHGGTLGSQSTRKKIWISIMINKQVHAIKNCCVLALRDLTPCAMRNFHAAGHDKTAAFSRRKLTWISLRAQRNIFLRRPQYR